MLRDTVVYARAWWPSFESSKIAKRKIRGCEDPQYTLKIESHLLSRDFIPELQNQPVVTSGAQRDSLLLLFDNTLLDCRDKLVDAIKASRVLKNECGDHLIEDLLTNKDWMVMWNQEEDIIQAVTDKIVAFIGQPLDTWNLD